MPSQGATRQESAAYDPSAEPLDEVGVGGANDTPESGGGEPEAPTPESSGGGEESADPPPAKPPKKGSGDAAAKRLLRELRKAAAASPPVTASLELVNARVADTGRALTDRQASALLRIQGYVTADRKRRSTFESRKYGAMPCVKPAHATLWLLDRLADLIEEIDGEKKSNT